MPERLTEITPPMENFQTEDALVAESYAKRDRIARNMICFGLVSGAVIFGATTCAINFPDIPNAVIRAATEGLSYDDAARVLILISNSMVGSAAGTVTGIGVMVARSEKLFRG